jgi:hypothetical protein
MKTMNKMQRRINVIIELLTVDIMSAKRDGWSPKETEELAKAILESTVMTIPRDQRAGVWRAILEETKEAVTRRTDSGE